MRAYGIAREFFHKVFNTTVENFLRARCSALNRDKMSAINMLRDVQDFGVCGTFVKLLAASGCVERDMMSSRTDHV